VTLINLLVKPAIETVRSGGVSVAWNRRGREKHVNGGREPGGDGGAGVVEGVRLVRDGNPVTAAGAGVMPGMAMSL